MENTPPHKQPKYIPRLWTRIVRESIDEFTLDENERADLQARIARATVLLDTRPWRSPSAKNWEEMKDQSHVPPFDEFFYERIPAREDSTFWGGLVRHTRASADEEGKIAATILFAGGDSRVWHVGEIELRLAADMTPIAKPKTKMSEFVKAACEYAGMTDLDTRFDEECGELFEVLRLMGCSNIGTRDNESDTEAARRAAKRHGATGATVFKTIVIRPAGAPSSHPGTDVSEMPLHMRRGHIRRCGPEYNAGKLFGRLSGKFYIPPSARGNEKNGRLVANYLIDEHSKNPKSMEA